MRKTIKNAIFTLLFLTLGTSTAFLIYLYFFAADDKDLSGEWVTYLDMTEQAAVTGLSWLQEIEAVSISLEDMGTYMQGLTIQVNMALEKTNRSEGIFNCKVSPESYEACNQAAYEAFAMAFEELVARRLHMAGYTGSTDKEAIEALISETFGMSTVSYLMSYGPALLPPLEELQAMYDGSGTYVIEDGILIRQFDSGAVSTKAEYYIRKDYNLILSGEAGAAASVPAGLFADDYPMIYTLKQSSK